MFVNLKFSGILFSCPINPYHIQFIFMGSIEKIKMLENYE